MTYGSTRTASARAEKAATEDSAAESQGSTTVSDVIVHKLVPESNLSDEWTSDQFQGRKVIVRLDALGEPCPYEAGAEVSFASFYFVCWRSFDASEPRQYAECTSFLLSMKELAVRVSGLDSIGQGSHRFRNNKFVMIPVGALYFVNFALAKSIGLDPSPKQTKAFPELIKIIPPAIAQPRLPSALFPDDQRVMVPVRPTGRVTLEALKRAPVLGRGIELRTSRIPNSGRGVYATRDFHTGELVTVYFGHIFGESQRKWMQSENLGSHSKPLQFKHSYLDGVKTALLGMRAGQLLNQGDASSQNCDWILLDVHPSSGEKVLGVRATRYVFPGEELYVSYGKKFWDEQLMFPSPPPPVILPTIEAENARNSSKKLKIDT